MIKAQLQAGISVCYRSSGWSLCPRVRSNDQTTYEPVTSADMVQANDIVCCQVQTSSRFYAHLVENKYLQGGTLAFITSNMQGWVNGWCRMEHMYGRLIECIS